MIAPPNPRFSDTDRRLIAFLACVLTGETGGNVGEDLPALTDTEAEYLVALLEKLLRDPRFQAASLFVEHIWTVPEDPRARRTYSAMRRAAGKDVSMVSREFGNLQKRLGLPSRVFPPGESMRFSFADFLRREDQLLKAAELEPRVRDLLIQFLTRRERELAAVASAGRPLTPSPYVLVKRTCQMVRRQALERRVGLELKTPRYASLLMMVIDSAAIFTTRDWSALGTLSTAAAVVGADMQAERDR